MDYARSGVNIKLGDEASRMLYEAAKKSFALRKGSIGEVIVPFDDFSGLRVIDVSKLPSGSVMCLGFDGVGTKVEIAQRMQDHSTIAFDLLAMVCDDAIVRGGEPVLVGSVLDVSTLGKDDDSNLKCVKDLAKGYLEAAKAANVAIINGELAELGNLIGGHGNFKYNWSSACIWFAKKERLFTGKEVREGDHVVVLEEKGFRSNGLSLTRKAFEEKYGENWHETKLDGKKLGSLVLTPSTIYSKLAVHLHGGFESDGCCEVHGVAHITGGGIPGKLGRVLKPSGLGAELEGLFSPCKAMLHCQEIGDISDEEAYRSWNMGQGLAIITPEPDKVISEAKKFGIKAMVAGKVVRKKGISLVSKGYFSEGKEIKF